MAVRGAKFGQDMGDQLAPQAAIDDPALGADATLAAPPPAPAVPDQRSPGLTPPPAGVEAINDDDLMTVEEQQAQAAKLAGLLGMDPAALGATPEYQHDENLAATIEPNDLDRIGQELKQQIDLDIESRKPWVQRFARGLEILGLTDFNWEKGTAPFEGASTAVLPLMGEAVMQSQARFMEEIFPAQGPCKTTVLGQETPELRDGADRVQDHMNYQLTKEDLVYFMESQKLALYLPIYGSGYRKAYRDFVEAKNVLRFIPGEDMILPYSARNLESSPRRTHRYKMGKDEYERGCAAGAWIKQDLGEPPAAQPDEIKQKIDRLDDKTPEEDPKDQEWTFYETDCRLDLPGHEDTDAAGAKTGIALPYTVTIEKDSNKVLAIRRCWKESDTLKKMRTRYAEYWYFPGLGSHGTGLIHWIGTIAEAGTDALRAFLDAATWANLQGGFKAKDAGTKAGEIYMKPGAWIDVDMTADELDKAFHTPPVRPPDDSLFKVLGLLIDLGRRFASTTDTMVGDQQAKGAPVGTTIALIEQGSKVYSGVHKRAHFACGIELQMLYDLNAEYVPEEGYPYKIPGDDKSVYRADYDEDSVSVIPVSDPNIFSQTQRIALAQTRYQIWKDNPSFFKGFQVLKSLFKAFKDPDVDAILVDPDEVPVMDPVTENIAIVQGRPVKAKDGENHDAHLTVHMSFAQHPQFGGLPQAQQLIGPAMLAHMAEHIALKYADVQRKMGVPVPRLNLAAPPGTSPAGPEQPGQADQIAMAAAQQVQTFMQQAGFTTTPPDQQKNQEAEDRHELMQAQTWSAVANALANMTKVGVSLQQAEQAEAVVLAGPGQAGAPAPGGGAAPAPAGAFGNVPRRAAPPRPGTPPPRAQSKGPALAPRTVAAAAPPDQAPGANGKQPAPAPMAGKAPGLTPARHDENIDAAPVHAAAPQGNEQNQ